MKSIHVFVKKMEYVDKMIFYFDNIQKNTLYEVNWNNCIVYYTCTTRFLAIWGHTYISFTLLKMGREEKILSQFHSFGVSYCVSNSIEIHVISL